MDIGSLLKTAPAVFLILLFCVSLGSYLLTKLAFRVKTPASDSGESYACGEDNYDSSAQPDYSNFFPFAFFFTLAHVATLIITTIPKENLQSFTMAVIYIGAAAVGLVVLFRK